MNSDHVKASIACYFRYKRQCSLVCFERSPTTFAFYNPDVIAINKHRKVVEVEVKVSLADLKNDAKKHIWKMREMDSDRYMPYQFYYAVPSDLKDKALVVIDQWKEEGRIQGNVGLISVKNSLKIGVEDSYVVKKAPINKKAPKLSVKEMIRMVSHQSGTLCSSAIRVAKMKNEIQELKNLTRPTKPTKPKKPKKPKKPTARL